jgi:hypothetical protein
MQPVAHRNPEKRKGTSGSFKDGLVFGLKIRKCPDAAADYIRTKSDLSLQTRAMARSLSHSG